MTAGLGYGAIAHHRASKRSAKMCPVDSPPSPWLRKPSWVARLSTDEDLKATSSDGQGTKRMTHGGLRRHLNLFDLVCVGVGATVGSGIFVLCGLIAHDYAGPATFISWAIAGVAACFSGLCYAELAGKYPTAGSSYAYSYVSMGELPAVIAGACLTLEYIFSASAVARSWGDKIVEYIRVNSLNWANQDLWKVVLKLLDPGLGFNPMAFLVAAASTALLLEGVKESKAVTNLFTVIKMGLVLFMAFGSLQLLDITNLSPLVPSQFGMSGIFRGATSSFFGYIGFDEICCISGEAKSPARNLPRAVIASLLIVTSLYMLAALALTGMVPYEDISSTSGFPDGFRYRGWEVAAQISAWGELITLPLVVLVTIMAQPRLQYAMSIDGLLPPIFSEVDSTGNLWFGTLISGSVMVIIATFVPFVYLDDLISAGILVAFSMTDTSVVLLRHVNPEDSPHLLEKLLGLFHILSFVTSLALGHCGSSTVGTVLAMSSCLFLLILARTISTTCPQKSSKDGGNSNVTDGEPHFEAPFVPYLPLLGTFINWYLVAQLEWLGILLLVVYVGVAVIFYFSYGLKHSVGNTIGWDHIVDYDFIPSDYTHEDQPLRSKLSLIQLSQEQDNDENKRGHTRAGSF